MIWLFAWKLRKKKTDIILARKIKKPFQNTKLWIFAPKFSFYIWEYVPASFSNCFPNFCGNCTSKPLWKISWKWRVLRQHFTKIMNLEWFLQTVFQSRVLSVLSWLPSRPLHRWLMWISTIITSIFLKLSKNAKIDLNFFEATTIIITTTTMTTTTISTSIISMKLWQEILMTNMNFGRWFLASIN